MGRMWRRTACFVLGLVLCAGALPASAQAAQPAFQQQYMWNQAQPPEVDAAAWLVMDAATGQVVASKNASDAHYPASITKILTLGLVLERIGLEEAATTKMRVSDAAVKALIPRASMVALMVDEEVSVKDLVYATYVESANDAANVLGEYVAGSMEAFASMMNDKAAELGLEGSSFVNPSGQPDENHYTTAYDMAVITRWAMGMPGFTQVFGTTKYQCEATNKQPAGRSFNNPNMILQSYSSYYCEGVTGSKTGYTDDALYTLVTTAKRGDTELICVVLRCSTNEQKYISTNAVLDYCFDNFHRVGLGADALSPGAVPVYGGGAAALGEIEVTAAEGMELLLHNSLTEDALEVRYDMPESYVIGQPFAPVANVWITADTPAQQTGAVASLQLNYTGLEELLAANNMDAQGLGTEGEEPGETPAWLYVLAGVALLVLLFMARALYVKHRRAKRRKRRLAAMRARQPVRSEARPQPPVRLAPSRQSAYGTRRPAPARQADYRRPAASVRVVNGGYAGAPRRAGGAR